MKHQIVTDAIDLSTTEEMDFIIAHNAKKISVLIASIIIES